jgi:acyl transferase domain-containing protein
LEKLNPHIDPGGVPIIIPTHSMPWFTNGGPRLAGVSSFGFVGTNAHVILGSAPEEERTKSPGNRTPAASRGEILPLSARSESGLRDLARRYAGWLTERPQVDLAAVARTLSLDRSHFECRAALTLSSKEDAALFTGGRAAGNGCFRRGSEGSRTSLPGQR